MPTPTIRPAFLADWRDAVFIHFRLPPATLHSLIPLPLDLRDGSAYLSLVAFTQRRLRPVIPTAFGRRAAAWMSRPLADHSFLNVRTYVRHGAEPGIFFLAEWIPNRLAQLIGPRLYGLPYHLGQLDYRCDAKRGGYRARVKARGRQLQVRALFDSESPAELCIPQSEAAFLLERYTAYTFRDGICRRFRVEHQPWPQRAARIAIERRDLIDWVGDRFNGIEPIGGHYSQGVENVAISPPRRISI